MVSPSRCCSIVIAALEVCASQPNLRETCCTVVPAVSISSRAADLLPARGLGVAGFPGLLADTRALLAGRWVGRFAAALRRLFWRLRTRGFFMAYLRRPAAGSRP